MQRVVWPRSKAPERAARETRSSRRDRSMILTVSDAGAEPARALYRGGEMLSTTHQRETQTGDNGSRRGTLQTIKERHTHT